MVKRKAKPVCKRLQAAQAELRKTLDKTGITALRASGVKALRPPLPSRYESNHKLKYPSAG